MRKVVDSLQAAIDIMYEGAMILPDSEVVALCWHLTRFDQHYKALHDLAIEEETTRWKIVPTFHFVVAHLATQAELINPRYVQGHTSESMVGEVCQFYAQSQSGPFHAKIQEVVLLKYRTGFKLLWC